MKLVELEITGYRSIKDQSGDEAIEFEGLDCLVGENNAGKTNILSAVNFLLENSEKAADEELYWQKDPDQLVEIRGYFRINDTDLDRIDDLEKRNAIEDALISYEDSDRIIGICRRLSEESDFDPKTKLLQYLPESDRLSESHLIEYRDEYWKKQKEDSDFTKNQYREKMVDEFPEIAERIPKQKRRNKGVWESTYWEYVESRPEELPLTIQPTQFKNDTKTVITDQLLPRVIPIPAVKEVDSATKRGGEFGDLIKQISTEVQDELDEKLQKKLAEFNPQSHQGITKVERHISDHLSSTFEEQSVKFDFPSLSTEYLFRNADIQIQEEHIESISKENVGEGVKRTLIFSLLRTLADLREGKLSIRDREDESPKGRPILILYEEAELFLHPSLQKTLLKTFDQLTGSNAQILFSTHSPVMIQYEILDTVNIVRKDPEYGTEVTQFHSVLEKQDEADKSRLTDLKSISSYIFADKVVLVEGISDRIVLKKIAKALDEEWNFERQSIPVLDAGGKGDVCRFKRFLEELGIEAFAVFDIDAAEQECKSVVSDESIIREIDELQEEVESEFTGPGYDIEELPTRIRTRPWDDIFSELESMRDRFEEEEGTREEDSDIIERVLSKCENSEPPNELWASDAVEDQRIKTVESLLDKDILLLSGELEDYYPGDNSEKRESALRFEPGSHAAPDLRENFQIIMDGATTDVELFFNKVFPDKSGT